jgi:hypothetical protein
MADRFVKDPGEVVKVQQKVMVTVLEVDAKRKRISLSLKKQTEVSDELAFILPCLSCRILIGNPFGFKTLWLPYTCGITQRLTERNFYMGFAPTASYLS